MVLLIVRIHPEDLELLRTKCRRVFLNYHPEFEGMKLTDPFMINKVIYNYLYGEDI